VLAGLSHKAPTTGGHGLDVAGQTFACTEVLIQPWHMQTLYCHAFALLVMGFPGAVECCNYVAAYLKDDLQTSP
jgi:hypothetical protein